MRPVELMPPQVQKPSGPDRPGGADQAGGASSPTSPVSFGEALTEALGRIDNRMRAADELATRYIAGEEIDLHTVIVEMQKADISFRTMLEVRNKLVDAYREIMNLQV